MTCPRLTSMPKASSSMRARCARQPALSSLCVHGTCTHFPRRSLHISVSSPSSPHILLLTRRHSRGRMPHPRALSSFRLYMVDSSWLLRTHIGHSFCTSLISHLLSFLPPHPAPSHPTFPLGHLLHTPRTRIMDRPCIAVCVDCNLLCLSSSSPC